MPTRKKAPFSPGREAVTSGSTCLMGQSVKQANERRRNCANGPRGSWLPPRQVWACWQTQSSNPLICQRDKQDLGRTPPPSANCSFPLFFIIKGAKQEFLNTWNRLTEPEINSRTRPARKYKHEAPGDPNRQSSFCECRWFQPEVQVVTQIRSEEPAVGSHWR